MLIAGFIFSNRKAFLKSVVYMNVFMCIYVLVYIHIGIHPLMYVCAKAPEVLLKIHTLGLP